MNARAALDRARALVLPEVLADNGVVAGDRVSLVLHNGFEFVESLLACHRIGACAVPVNFRLAIDEMQYILEDSEAVALISGEQLADQAVRLRAAVPSLSLHLSTGARQSARPPSGTMPYDEAVASTPPLLEPALVREHDIAVLCYTSGTTGRPKGSMLSHRSLVASTLSWIHEMSAGEGDVWLSGQPLFHIGGINGLLPFLALGATSILTPTTGFDPNRALGLLEAHGVTMCIFVPTQWDGICASPRVREIDARGSASRGGAPRRPRVKRSNGWAERSPELTSSARMGRRRWRGPPRCRRVATRRGSSARSASRCSGSSFGWWTSNSATWPSTRSGRSSTGDRG